MVSVEIVSLYCLIYIIPGCIFYCYFIFLLFTNKDCSELKSRFYGIVKILAFIDLAEILFAIVSLRMGYLLSRLHFFQPIGEYNFVATIFYFGTVFFSGVQATLHVVLAFNRLTAVLFPLRYSTLWNGKYFYVIIFIAFLFPCIMYSWMIYFGGTVKLSPIFNTHVIDGRMVYFGGTVKLSPIFNTHVIDGIRAIAPWLRKPYVHITIIASTCFLAFAFDFFAFVLLKKGNLIKSNTSRYKQEFRLLTVSVAFLCVHILSLTTAIYSIAFPISDGTITLIFLQCTTEIQSLISPFCVLLVNNNLRRNLFSSRSDSTVVANIRQTF